MATVKRCESCKYFIRYRNQKWGFCLLHKQQRSKYQKFCKKYIKQQ